MTFQINTHSGTEATPVRAIQLLDKANRMTPWDRLGQKFEDPDITVPQAFHQAGMLFEVGKDTMYRKDRDGNMVEVRDNYVLVNRANDDQLDIVGSRYEVVQNNALAVALDPCRAWGRVAAAGNTGFQGKTSFVAFEGEEFDLKTRLMRLGDTLRMYTTARETKELGTAIEIQRVALRLQCINGLIYAETSNIFNANVRHVKGVNNLMSWIGDAIGIMAKIDTGFKQDMKRFASKKVTDQDAVEMFNTTFYIPDVPRDLARMVEMRDQGILDQEGRELLAKKENAYANSVEAVQKARAACIEAYQGECFSQGIAGSVYGALQAVTAVCDHRVSRKPKEVAHSAIFGMHAAAKIRAYKWSDNFSRS